MSPALARQRKSEEREWLTSPCSLTVTALYDYEAQSGDEHHLSEGEVVRLTVVGLEAGDGWAEVTKEGRAGLVPVSYLQV